MMDKRSKTNQPLKAPSFKKIWDITAWPLLLGGIVSAIYGGLSLILSLIDLIFNSNTEPDPDFIKFSIYLVGGIFAVILYCSSTNVLKDIDNLSSKNMELEFEI